MTTRTILLTLLATCLMLWSCDTKTKNVDQCGDGIIDPGEDCDGSVLTISNCEQLGYYNSAPVTCKPDCTLDLTLCAAKCGDRVIQVQYGEECEGDDLGDFTCSVLGLGGGTLA